MPRNPNGFLAQRKAEHGKNNEEFQWNSLALFKKQGIQMTERHLNWILLRKIKKADESLGGPINNVS